MGDVPRALLQEKYLECTEVLKEEQCHEKGREGAKRTGAKSKSRWRAEGGCAVP